MIPKLNIYFQHLSTFRYSTMLLSNSFAIRFNQWFLHTIAYPLVVVWTAQTRKIKHIFRLAQLWFLWYTIRRRWCSMRLLQLITFVRRRRWCCWCLLFRLSRSRFAFCRLQLLNIVCSSRRCWLIFVSNLKRQKHSIALETQIFIQSNSYNLLNH